MAHIVSGTYKGELHVWHPTLPTVGIIEGHTEKITLCRALSGGRFVVSSRHDGKVTMYNEADLKVLRTLNVPTKASYELEDAAEVFSVGFLSCFHMLARAHITRAWS